MSSDKAEELLPAASGEGLGASVRQAPLLPLPGLVFDTRKDVRIKRLLQVLLSQRGTLHVVRGPDLVCHAPSPRAEDRLDLAGVQVDEHVDVEQEVRLGADQDDGRGAVTGPDLGDPFLGDVVERCGVDDAETQDEDVCLGVGERAETVEFFLKWQD